MFISNDPFSQPNEDKERGIGKVFVRIADITIALMSEDRGLNISVRGEMRKFLVEDRGPDLEIGAAWGELGKEPKGGKLFDAGGPWQLYQDEGSYTFRFTSPPLGPFPYKVATFDPNFTTGVVTLSRQYFQLDQPVYPLEFPLDELLMVHFLAMGRGAEVHACGAVDSEGFGHLFVGQSGAGKTTVAKLWQRHGGLKVLSDDRMILRRMGDDLWMYGTPWHGEARLASPTRARLRRVYFLCHAMQERKKPEVFPLTRTEVVARLMACSFVPFYNPGALDFTLGFFDEVPKATPCYEISFFPDVRVVDFVRGLKD